LGAAVEADPSDLDRALYATFQLVGAVARSEDVDIGILAEVSRSAADLARQEGDNLRLLLALIARARAVTMRAAWTELEDLAAEIDACGNQYHRMIAQVLRGTALARGPSPISLAIAHTERNLAPPGQDPRRLARVRLVRASFLAALQGPGARPALEEAVRELQSVDPRAELFVADRMALAGRFMGDLPLAMDSLSTIVSLRRAQGDSATLSTDLADLAACMLELGRPPQEVRPVVAEAELLTGRGDALSASLVAALGGVVASREGDLKGAAELAGRGIDLIDRTDDCWAQADIRAWASEVAQAGGDLPRARALLQEALDRYRLKEFTVLAGDVEERLRALTPSGGRPGR
ncbi:MAG TPA: hypothetical protein VFK43_04070, partial [Acidimicrobiales bacterium]|nr:hypothetical protein [Acidimicrobiales bacterium]